MLATQNQSLFTRLKQWFYRNVIKTSEQTTVLGTKAAQRKTYALMLKAEKAAMNKVSGEGIAYSTKNGIDKTPSRANNIGDLRNQFHNALTKSEWNTFYQRIADSGALVSAVGDIFYTEIGNKLIVAKREYTETKDAHDFIVKDAYEANPNESYLYENLLNAIRETQYDPERIRTEFNRIASSHGESGLLRRYSSSDSTYVELNAKSQNSRGTGTEFPTNNRIFSDRKGSILETEQSGLRDNGILTKNNKSYSAKPSETAQRITEDFSYTDTTANNIVKAARTLRQKADSKADLNELAYTIAQTLEDRRNGNTNGRDAELIAMMLAENTEVVNEDFVAEYKPILDRLNGMKISISEADISDLGDAFSYVKKRLFLTAMPRFVHLTKNIT